MDMIVLRHLVQLFSLRFILVYLCSNIMYNCIALYSWKDIPFELASLRYQINGSDENE